MLLERCHEQKEVDALHEALGVGPDVREERRRQARLIESLGGGEIVGV
jgi:hypothetical protein